MYCESFCSFYDDEESITTSGLFRPDSVPRKKIAEVRDKLERLKK